MFNLEFNDGGVVGDAVGDADGVLVGIVVGAAGRPVEAIETIVVPCFVVFVDVAGCVVTIGEDVVGLKDGTAVGLVVEDRARVMVEVIV